MILGAGPFQLAAIRKAQEIGLMVIACSNNPTDPGLRIADIPCPISTTEKEQLLNFAKKEAISGVMTMGTDVSVPSVAFIAENLGLPGISQKIALTVTDKGYFREFLKESGFSCPAFGIAETVTEACKVFADLNSSAIMKPVLSSGSRGIVRIQSITEVSENFSQSVANSFGRKVVIIEEFLDGREVGGEALVFRGNVVFFHLTNKYINSYFVPTGHSMPSDLPKNVQDEVQSLIQRVVKALGIESSPINFDVMLTENGPVILEMGCRLGGNCLPALMTKSTGIDTVTNAIKIALGEAPVINAPHNSECYHVMILGSEKAGILKTITPESVLHLTFPENIVSVRYRYAVGDKIKKFDQGAHNLGYIFIKAESLRDLDTVTEEIIHFFNITISD